MNLTGCGGKGREGLDDGRIDKWRYLRLSEASAQVRGKRCTRCSVLESHYLCGLDDTHILRSVGTGVI